MAAYDPETEKIIADCKRNMQLLCDPHNSLFEMGTSDIKIKDKYEFFILGNRILLGSKHPYDYSIAAGSMQSDVNFIAIDKGKFLITTFDPSNDPCPAEMKPTAKMKPIAEMKPTFEIVDAPLMIAVKVNDKYNFIGLAVVGAENKTGIFSIIESLSNDALKKELFDAVKESLHIHCFKDENSFFNDGKFKPGINTNERGHAAAEIRRLKKEIRLLEEKINQLKWEEEIRLFEEPCMSKKQQIKAQEKINTIEAAQIKAQERVSVIEEALKKNSPEKLHLLLEWNSPSFCSFFTDTKKRKPTLYGNVVYRSLSKTSGSVDSPKI